MHNLALCVLYQEPGETEVSIWHWELIDLGTTNTHGACEAIVRTLDARATQLSFVTEVALEAQMKASMKQVATAIQVWFLCRMPEAKSRFVSARGKLSAVVSTEKRSYAENKRLAVQECRRVLLEDTDCQCCEEGHGVAWSAFLATHDKQDDLCDAFLQGKHVLLGKRRRV